MRWLESFGLRVRFLLSPGRRFRELDAEVLFHLEQLKAENMAAGMSAEAARTAAMRAFGNPLLVRDRTQETWLWTEWERVVEDVRFALRQMARSPGFAAVAIVILALGIGANTAIFSLTHALLLSSLPVHKPGELVRVALDMEGDVPASHDVGLSLPMIEAIRSQSRSFNGVLGWSVYDFVFKAGGSTHGIHGATVSGNAFEVLGVKAELGRMLQASDDRPGGGTDGYAAVISHRKWRTEFQGDPHVIGMHVSVTDHPVTIVGVAPAGFEGVLVAEHPDIYLPLEFDAALNGAEGLHGPGRVWLTTLARLKTGADLAQAQAEMEALLPGLLDQLLPAAARHRPWVDKVRIRVSSARTGWSPLRLQYRRPLLVLQLLVGAVLLICCANLSGLFLARAAGRQQEFAIRGALGAPRGRLIRQLLVESLLLTVPGATLGVALAWMAGPLLLHALGDRQAEMSLSARPDLTVLTVTAAAAVLCAVLFGMAPAWRASRMSMEASLRASNRQTRAGTGTVRGLLVPFQIAASLVLVVVATLLGATVVHLRALDVGYRMDNVLFYIADFNRLPQKGAELIPIYRRMAARLAGSQGVIAASVAEIPPLLGWSDGGEFVAAENPQHAAAKASDVNQIGAGYFAAVGVPMLAGRDLRDSDADQSSCVLNRTAAATYFAPSGGMGEGALGKQLQQVMHDFKTGEETRSTCTVIGVAADSKYDNVHDADPAIVYLPLTARTAAMTRLFFVIHGRSEAEARAAYRSAIREIAPTTPETEPFLFTQQFQDSIAREQLMSALSGYFAVLALLLSVIGIYGLMSWSVSLRRPEIGLRLALGASRACIARLVLRQVLIVLGFGLAAGAVGGVFAARAIRGFLFNVEPGSPATYIISALVLLAAGCVAATFPTAQAVRIEPAETLRAE